MNCVTPTGRFTQIRTRFLALQQKVGLLWGDSVCLSVLQVGWVVKASFRGQGAELVF